MNDMPPKTDSPSLLLRKNPDDNICNLCLLPHDSLSEEHVPPQCTGNNGSGKYFNCFPNLQRTIQTETYSNGISFLTVCKKCNLLLGERYDKAISKLYGTVRHNQRESNVVSIRLRPNAIIRGLMGHFISAKTSHVMSKIDEDFRNCAIDPDSPIPDNYHFYVMYYPYRIIRIVRDIVMIPNIFDNLRVVMSVVKIDPLAFIFTDQPFLGSNFIDWHEYIGISWKKEINVSIPKNVILPYDMPECDSHFSRVFGLSAYQSVCATIDKRSK